MLAKKTHYVAATLGIADWLVCWLVFDLAERLVNAGNLEFKPLVALVIPPPVAQRRPMSRFSVQHTKLFQQRVTVT